MNDDVLPDGSVVSKGVMVSWMPYVMGRSKDLWEDPLQFKPERFINQTHSPFKANFFNCGPRICLGKTLAELQGVFLLASIFKDFDITTVNRNPTYGKFILTYDVSLTLPIKNGLQCQIK